MLIPELFSGLFIFVLRQSRTHLTFILALPQGLLGNLDMTFLLEKSDVSARLQEPGKQRTGRPASGNSSVLPRTRDKGKHMFTYCLMGPCSKHQNSQAAATEPQPTAGSFWAWGAVCPPGRPLDAGSALQSKAVPSRAPIADLRSLRRVYLLSSAAHHLGSSARTSQTSPAPGNLQPKAPRHEAGD